MGGILYLEVQRLPGRRGKGQDFLQLPMSFRDFSEVAHGIQFMDDPLNAESFLTDKGALLISRLMAQRSELEIAFSRYSKIGGLPLLVKDYVEQRIKGTYSDNYRISSESIQVLWNVITGDITKARREPVAALKLLQATGNSLGSTLSWLSASRTMGFEKPDTATWRCHPMQSLKAATLCTITDAVSWRPSQRTIVQRALYPYPQKP